MNRTKRVVLAAVFFFCTSVAAQAGPYTNDGIEGFVNGQVNPIFQAWATGYVDYLPYDLESIQNYAGGAYADPNKTLGEVTGSNTDIASLGDMNQDQINAWLADPASNAGPGQITLSFDSGISDGTGYDFAVFENGFGSETSLFAELGFVEVSTNGADFARFDAVSLTDDLVGAYGNIDPTNVHNLAGKHPNAYGTSQGTGFDLVELADNAFVLNGLVDLDNINYVRIVDIPGSGDFIDSLGNPIYDAWVTWDSGGVDLEAVGVINTAAVPLPAAVWLLGSGLAGLAGLRQRRKRS